MWQWESVQNRRQHRRWTDRCREPTLPPKNANFEALCNFFPKRNFDTGFQIIFVGTMDISSYTNSGQPRVAGKYLTRLANNGIAIVTYTSRISQVFSRVGNRRPWIELISSLITFLFSSVITFLLNSSISVEVAGPIMRGKVKEEQPSALCPRRVKGVVKYAWGGEGGFLSCGEVRLGGGGFC